MDTQSFSKTPKLTDISNGLISLDNTLQLRKVNTDHLLGRNSLQDIFLSEDNFEDAEIFYPSKMNDFSQNVLEHKEADIKKNVQPLLL